MKKSLIALAVAGAFAAPAFAATSNVDISGKIAVGVESVSGTGTAAATTHVQNYNSVITVAGNEDLGAGMKAFFSVGYGLPLSSAGALSGQNQIVGLEGGFGKVFGGAFDNPMKVLGRGHDLFADQLGDFRSLTVGAADARANNVLAYVSPSFSGAQIVLAHAADETTNANSSAINMVKVTYANGPLTLGLAHHTVDDGGDEAVWRLAGGYTMGDTKFNVVYTSGKDVSAANDDIKTWLLGVGHKMGPITLKAQYVSLNDNGAGQDAKQYALGADYALSKRTTLQVAYSKVKNDTAATYAASGAVAGTDAMAPVAGNDPSAWGLGVKHTF